MKQSRKLQSHFSIWAHRQIIWRINFLKLIQACL